jgi:hypothetical protein
MYISTVWYLTSVVSVLEDKYYGLAAMRKSNKLIKGKRTTALALFLLNFTFCRVIGKLFVYAVVDGRSHGVGIAARAVYGTLLLGLLCFVNLMGKLTQGVLYFVCKSYHHESIDNNSSFKVYNVGDYEPLKASNNQLKLYKQRYTIRYNLVFSYSNLLEHKESSVTFPFICQHRECCYYLVLWT